MYFNDGAYSFSWNGAPRAVANAWVVVPYTPPTCYSLNTNINPGGSGSVNSSPGPNCNGNQYSPGTNVQVTANAISGYSFSSWSGDVGGNSNPVTVTMNGDRSVTANFSQDTVCYTLTISLNPNNGGAVNRDPQPNCGGGQYMAGTNVQLTAVANSGFSFSSWSGDTGGSTNPTTITMNGNRNVTAIFQASIINYWKGDYFSNTTLSGTPTLTRDDFSLDFDWANGSADPSLPSDFSGQWSRTFYFPNGTFRFHIEHDDGVRFYINNVLRLDQWSTCCRWDSVDVPLSPGNQTLRLDWFDSGGAANLSFYWEPVDITGWKAEYFNNDTLTGHPILIEDVPEINFDWQGGTPDPMVRNDNFSIRWSKTVSFPGGLTTFYMWHDDGIRLFIDNGLVYENWCNNCRQTDQVIVSLSPGSHSVKLEMFENIGWSGAHLWWSAPFTGYFPFIGN